jgi:hypothetical protein
MIDRAIERGPLEKEREKRGRDGEIARKMDNIV